MIHGANRRSLRAKSLGAICLSAALGCGGGDPPEGESSKLNLLVISLDTLRADRLGCYGYDRDTSPALDAFAERSVRFEHAIAPAPWTLPSHFSLLTGLLPSSHGVNTPLQLPGDDTQLLAELLYPAGWYTLGMTDGGYMSGSFGFKRGFRAFLDQDHAFQNMIAKTLTYLGDRESLGPWFAFLHTYDIHCPYNPTEPYASMFQTEGRVEADIDGKCGNPALNGMNLTPEEVLFVSDRYDGGIREADAALANLFAYLEENGRFEDSVIVITSDHGEELMEHGQIGHERSLQRELLEVPLLIYAPGLEPGVITSPVSLVDVVPTVLDLLDVPLPDNLDGCSLLPLIEGSEDPAQGQPSSLHWQVAMDAWWSLDNLLIVDRDTQGVSLFDLASDPPATVDRSSERSAQTQALMEQLTQRLSEGHARSTNRRAIPTAEEAASLRALGYADNGEE